MSRFTLLNEAEIKPIELDSDNTDERIFFMKILLNQKEISFSSNQISVAELIESNKLPSIGIAVAVNNKVVRKAKWISTYLQDGDSVTVITAVCGG